MEQARHLEACETGMLIADCLFGNVLRSHMTGGLICPSRNMTFRPRHWRHTFYRCQWVHISRSRSVYLIRGGVL